MPTEFRPLPHRVILAALAFVLGSQAPALAAEPVVPGHFTGDLRDLPLVAQEPPMSRAAGPERRTRPPLLEAPPSQSGPDPLLTFQRAGSDEGLSFAFSQPATGFDNLLIDIEGIPNQFVTPPDTVGDVGALYYIQQTNGGSGSPTLVIDKNTGATVAGPFNLASLWSGSGSSACASGRGDPITLYDQYAQRWLLSEFAATGNHLCVYISATSDPLSGGWHTYDFETPHFPDYPKYGVWPDLYLVGTNEASPTAYALDRTAMLSGLSASFVRTELPVLGAFGFQLPVPVDANGPLTPPAGAKGMFLRHSDDEAHEPGSANSSEDYIEIWTYDINFTGASSLILSQKIAVAEFESELCGYTSFECVPQPGTSTGLDPLREPVMNAPQYRNFGTHQSIVLSWVVDVGGGSADHHGIRWVELRHSPGTSGSWSLHQEGTYAPDANHRFMSSIAMDGSGNIAMGYSISSNSVYPGIRYVGRTSTDTLGLMTTGEQSIIEGTGSQSFSTRYGDYSAIFVDPIDECTFWYTNEYIPANGDWNTRIAAFRFDSPICQASTCGDDTTEGAEQCDGSDDSACPGACQADCTCPAVCGDNVTDGAEECDGADDGACLGLCVAAGQPDECTCPAPFCGNDVVQDGEECDGTSASACGGVACQGDCTCPNPVCGNDVAEAGEECDGADAASCGAAGCASTCVCESGCGDGVCATASAETAANCAADCGCAAAPMALCESVTQAPGGCFCDTQCTDFGDCCPDVCDACSIGCVGSNCDTAPKTDCREPPAKKGKLTVVNHPASASKDKLTYIWSLGATPTVIDDFKDPVNNGSTEVRLCVYDESGTRAPGLVSQTTVYGGSGWKATSAGFLYKDKTLSVGGVKKISLSAKNPEKAKLVVQMKGENLDTPTLPVIPEVKVQLVIQKSGRYNCWEANFSNPKRNDTSRFTGVSE